MPESLLDGLQELEKKLTQQPPAVGEKWLSPKRNCFIGHTLNRTRVGFLFPGQGSQHLNMARSLVERHDWARDLVTEASSRLKEESGIELIDHIFKPVDRAPDQGRIEQWAAVLRETQIAQPAICLASVLWCKKMDRFGISPVAVAGHSLGELTAFHAAGAFDEATLLKLAAMRGQAMVAPNGERGTMASLACYYESAAAILKKVEGYVIAANINSPRQLVISGERKAVEQAVAIAQAEGIGTRMLQVSNAFHSRFVADAAKRLRSAAPVPAELNRLKIKLFSGLGGLELKEGLNLRNHFADQVISQVDFVAIVHAMAGECDLILEVGPGKVLGGLTQAITDDKGPLCLPVESKPGRDRDLHFCLAHLFVQGGTIHWEALFEDRLVRPFVPAAARSFIVNPCERPLNPDQSAILKIISPESDILHSTLAATTGLAPRDLSEYLARRGPFLNAMIKADMENLSKIFQPHEAVAKNASTSALPQAATMEMPTAAKHENDQDNAIGITDLVFELIEKRTGFPLSSLTPEMRLQDDLNLDSIKVGEMVIVLSRRLKLSTHIDPGTFANASIAELIVALEKGVSLDANQDHEKPADQSPLKPLNPARGIRTFVMQKMEAPLEAESLRQKQDNGHALIIGDPLSEKDQALHTRLIQLGLQATLTTVNDSMSLLDKQDNLAAMIIILPQIDTLFRECDPEEFDQRTEGTAGRLFDIFHRVLENRHSLADFRCLIVRPKCSIDLALEMDGFAAFLKTLGLEHPEAALKWIDLPESWSSGQWVETVTAELERQGERTWFSYDENGVRYTDTAVLPSRGNKTAVAYGRTDVMLVSGGARGITFELSLAMARKHGVKLALIGSSPMPDPNSDDDGHEMTVNFQRLKKEGIEFVYFPCDVRDSKAVNTAVHEIQRKLGPVSIILHGAGFTRPAPFLEMRREEYLKCIQVKVRGLYNLLRAVPVASLKGLHALSSVLGHTGMQGQADYTLANGWLDGAVASFAQSYPQVHCLSIGYSVWSETGLGKKMGLVGSLVANGVVPIDNRSGVETYLELLQGIFAGTTFVVTGPLTPELDRNLFLPSSQGPCRFLERIVSHTPNREIVAEATISHQEDLYLAEHVFQGTPIMPGVMAVEAMVETAAACIGMSRCPDRLEKIHFHRPLIVPDNTQTTVRIQGSVLESEPGCIRVGVVLRSEEDGFRKDHFSLECLFGTTGKTSPASIDPASIPAPLQIDLTDFEPVPLFQGKLFRRIRSLRRLQAGKGGITEIQVPVGERYFRSTFELGYFTQSPAVRDSALQSAGLALPEMCLPVSVGGIGFYGRAEPGSSVYCTSQIITEKDRSYTVNISLFDGNGKPLEILEGVLFSATDHWITATEKFHPQPLPVTAVKEHFFSEGIIPHALCLFSQKEIKGKGTFEIAGRNLKETDIEISPPCRNSVQPGLVAVRRAVVDYAKRILGLQVSGTSVCVKHRADGKPGLEFQDHSMAAAFSGIDLSLTDCGENSAALIGPAPLGLDMETVESRDAETWRSLLGDDGYDLALRVSNSALEPFDHAATRVWTLIEAGKKAFSLKRIIPSYEGSSHPGVQLFTLENLSPVAEYHSVAIDLGGDERNVGMLSIVTGKISRHKKNIVHSPVRRGMPEDLCQVNDQFLEQLSQFARLCTDDPDHPETEDHYRAYVELIKQKLADFERLSHEMSPSAKRSQQLRCSRNLLEFLRRERVEAESFGRALEKPLGYPGDYLLMDIILKNKVNTRGLGYHLDRKFLSSSGAEGVRQRTYWAVERIEKTFITSGKKDFTLLDLGCGPMTIEKMLAEKYGGSEISFTFFGLDIDRDVMSFAQKRFTDLPGVTLETRECNLLSPAGLAEVASIAPCADLILSMGFFDYLDPATITAFLETLRSATREEAGILFANYQPDHGARISMEWLLDWWLIYKTPEEMASICRAAGLLDGQTEIKNDESESVVLVEVRR